MIAKLRPATPVHYPDTDNEPMAENTVQFRWIVTIEGGFEALFRDDPNVFIAGDLFWYPVEGNNKIRRAPDILLVFGRPKKDRLSYLQWLEGNIPPQVVWEVLSLGNRNPAELKKKFDFYEQYGVEEYYLYDPEYGTLSGYLRVDGRLRPITNIQGWRSPRTGVTMRLEGADLVLIGPDGKKFVSYQEMVQRAERSEAARLEANQRAASERDRAEQEQKRAEQERQRAEQLAAQLKALGIEPQA